eukprot:846953-Pyramimonas_sp.AAC.1
MPLDKVGTALLGQAAAATIDDALKLYPDGPMPPFVGEHGLTACNFSQRNRASNKLPSDSPAAPSSRRGEGA